MTSSSKHKSDHTSFTIPGLTAPAEIIVDEWGVPHIYAATKYDAFRVQGFNAARDRLWQIDLWRRRGLGKLSEVLGPEYVDRDRAARLFLFRGDMHTEWLAYGSDTKRASTAFVEGINTFVQLTHQQPEFLPAEFKELGYEPAFWKASEITAIRSHGLFYNLREEVARALTIRDHGKEAEEIRRQREPHHDLTVPKGLDLNRIPDDVLAVYDLATMPPLFNTDDPKASQNQYGASPDGSNNWVLNGRRTSSGRPILANDPHRATGILPGLRYIAHLNAPGLNVIGGGEPSLPGISIGHNGRIAFGLTIFSIDQEDLYVYELNPDNPSEYRYQARWESMRMEQESIEVNNGDVVNVELAFTRHGPVIYTDVASGTAIAVRAAWLQPGMAPYLGSMDYMRAQNWDEFIGAMNRWGAPPENQIYADIEGNIGWKAGGLTPIRSNWDGTLPVPGDGTYEWSGFYDMDQLPGCFNPDQGFIATANDMNLPEDFPTDRHISYDWQPPYRRQRIKEVLANESEATIPSMFALQTDYISLPARRILAVVRALPIPDPAAVDGLNLLLSWDYRLEADSAAGAIFEVWYRRHLRPALLIRAAQTITGEEDNNAMIDRISNQDDLMSDSRIDIDLLEQPGTRLGSDPAQFLADTVANTLTTALVDLNQLLGPDRSLWAWGRLHVAQAKHPFAGLLHNVDQQKLGVGPLPRGGSGDTVGLTAYTADFVQSAGSTFRLVIDVGEWDESLATNAPGQSGNFDSPHYTDLFEPWVAGEPFPLLYTRERIEAAAKLRIRLSPSKD